MSKHKNRAKRTPGIPAAATSAAEPLHDGTIRFVDEQGRVDHMKYWHGPEGAYVANAAASLEG
ncbi:MAG: hypothetical protein ABL901_01090 [Hyphomicrobiaceae bacterium]